jgi:hypothetical protein
LQQAEAALQQKQPPSIVDHLAYLARRHAEAGEARVSEARSRQEVARAQPRVSLPKVRPPHVANVFSRTGAVARAAHESMDGPPIAPRARRARGEVTAASVNRGAMFRVLTSGGLNTTQGELSRALRVGL